MEWRNLSMVLADYGDKLVQEYKNNLTESNAVASGKLRDTVTYTMKIDDNFIEIGLNLQDYWKWIESGRPPTTQSGNGELRRAILNWIKVKPIMPRPYNGKLPTEEQLAYLISRKIHREGYKGKGLLRQSVDDVNQQMMNDIKAAIIEDVKAEMDEVLILLLNKG